MADLSNIFGGAWSPPTQQVQPAEHQFIDAIRAAGLDPPERVIFDGKIHRFRSGGKGTGTKGGDKPGWYLVFGDGVPAGRFGCWRQGVESAWRADVGRKLTPSEEMAHAKRLAEARALRDAEQARLHEVTASTVETIWEQAQAAHADHPYLARKGIGVHGARVTGDGRLVLPLYGSDGHLSSLQYIAHDGSKLYHAGGQTGGKYWQIGTLDEPGVLYLAEGFATAATIHEATGRPCVVAYSASNLVTVTGQLRDSYGAVQDLVIVADHDKSGIGQRYAEQACAKHGARMVIPPIEGDANDFVQSGHDLTALLAPPDTDWLTPADEFSAQPAPIRWLVKHWIQRDALIMVHGPSGGGKTFVVLDWCLRIAAGLPEWHGHQVKAGSVVYLAGEGHHGLRGRIAAWKQHHQAASLSMWLSKSGCDLNIPPGYLQAIEHLRALPVRPDVIVVDTLHRFLAGDENSAQDAKTMLDACASLMAELRCSVILVHHTGVAEEAQHRARGSSAWRGALDVEISIIPAKASSPLQIVQRKLKDAELSQPLHADLQPVTLHGWHDEDGLPVTSAVIVPANAPTEPRQDSKLDAHRKTFENAWWASGAEERDGKPYLSRSALLDYLTEKLGISEPSARQYVKPSVPGKLISDLLVAEIITSMEHGWVVAHAIHASSLLLRKAG